MYMFHTVYNYFMLLTCLNVLARFDFMRRHRMEMLHTFKEICSMCVVNNRKARN